MNLSKFTSARFILALCFGATACAGFLLKLVPVDSFMTLAGSVITFYFTRTRVQENPLFKDESHEPTIPKNTE